jgi:Predicted nucleoside-diphosphate sugar epimerases
VYSGKAISKDFLLLLCQDQPSGLTIPLTAPLKTHLFSPDWSNFLSRNASSESRTGRQPLLGPLSGRGVLVTGAGGCIGSALATTIAQSNARELILLDASEGALYDIQQSLAEMHTSPRVYTVLASVSDSAAIGRIFERHQPQVIFHAAAFKHVPMMENNPFGAVANNALGTRTLVDAAEKCGCEQLLMVSTDKAVVPSSIMGASKRIAELILLAPRTASLKRKIVRLGNVLGSSGSVVPLFERQIAQGGPVTVSHPDVRRYFMTICEAVDTLLAALSPDVPTGLSVPELGEPIRILDLAKFLIGQRQVPIVFTELRPGDKMEELLISSSESYCALSSGSLRAVDSPTLSPSELASFMESLRRAIEQSNLSSLLETVQRVVPEYSPSRSLASAAMVNA